MRDLTPATRLLSSNSAKPNHASNRVMLVIQIDSAGGRSSHGGIRLVAHQRGKNIRVQDDHASKSIETTGRS